MNVIVSVPIIPGPKEVVKNLKNNLSICVFRWQTSEKCVL